MYKLSFDNQGLGQIQIDDFKESFDSDFSFWTKERYEEHWQEASNVLKSGRPVSFLTSISDPATANFFRAWSCYPQGDELVFQEQILFLEDMDPPFAIDAPHNSALSYESLSEDGYKISEWRTWV